ncbi:MAG TPA: GTP 3',8-cyclase MoaA [Nitrospirae bacterium]|nr:GTP 3',8-cyclase MoaA [Nitrospirota bacterium]
MNMSAPKPKNSNQPLMDSYDRRIDYLRISVTDKCNLKCVYCSPGKDIKYFDKTEVLTFEEIVRFVNIVRKNGLRKIRITGGEPLMKKNITRLISSIKQAGIQDLSLTTNGTKLAGLAVELKKAGLDRVNISLDTMDPGKYRSITNGGDINSVWQAIEEAERVGLSPVKINVVPIRGLNDDEILSFASLTFGKDYHVRFIEFMPVGRNEMWRKDKCIDSKEVLERISAIGSLESLSFRGKGPSRNFRIKGAKGVIGIISPISDHFCGVCNRLRLTIDGKIRPCLFSQVEIDIKTPMRNGASDIEIEQLFYDSIKVKPQRHLLHENAASSEFLQAMSKIGG